MNKPDLDEKPNLFAELAKRKAMSQGSGNKFGVLGKDLSGQFYSRPNKFLKPTKPGGRNGQGKP